VMTDRRKESQPSCGSAVSNRFGRIGNKRFPA